MQAAVLLLLGLAVRLVPAGEEPPRGRELWGAPLVGLAVAIAWGAWLAPIHLDGGWTASDFPDYCTSIESLRHGRTAPWYMMRSVTSGLLPGLFATKLGVLDGLAAASSVSAFGIGAGLYVWGWALGGWRVGLAAALCASTIAPLAILPRMLSFYPDIVAALVVGTAAIAYAARVRTPGALAWGAGGVGLCMLIEARGLLWGLSGLGMLVPAAIFGTGRVRARFAAVLVPLAIAWLLGPPLTAPTLSLEGQIVRMLQFNGVRVTPEDVGTQWTWGRSAPWELVPTLQNLARLSRLGETSFHRTPFQDAMYTGQVLPWVPVVAASAGLALWALRRDRWALFTFVATTAPFAVSLRSAAMTEPADRFLAIGAPAVAIAMALAWTALTGLGARRAMVSSALLMLLTAGILPTWLGPHASWRTEILANPEPLNVVKSVTTGVRTGGPPVAPICAAAVRADVAAGRIGHLVLP